MIVTEKRETKKQIKRERILEAAANLFSQKSYHEVMMEDVAKLTSVAKGTVYNYFSSKEDLYFSIMCLRMENLIRSLKQQIKVEQNSIDSLRSFTVHLYMFMMKYQNFFLMYRKESLNSENDFCVELRHLDHQLKTILSGIIDNGSSENVFRNIDKDFAVTSIMGTIYGTIQRNIETKIDDNGKKIERERLFEFILHALYSGFKNNVVLPLKNKTIIITRTVEQSNESASELTKYGAKVIVFPTLEIVPPSNWDEFDSIISSQDKIDFIIFTSAHAVQMFNQRCNELKIKINFSTKKVVAVGNKTSSVCEKYNIPVDVIPERFSSEGVVEMLAKFNLNKKVVFIPRSAIGREELPRGLKELGAVINSVPVYNVSLPTKENIKNNLDKLNSSNPDLFIFTSPSTFENFLQILNVINPAEYFKGYDIAAIGPTTKTAIENRRVKVSIMPDEYTIEGLIKKILSYYNT
jgi:uroporphyrinogen-III synthase/AcrR family transcriptional regulator